MITSIPSPFKAPSCDVGSRMGVLDRAGFPVARVERPIENVGEPTTNRSLTRFDDGLWDRESDVPDASIDYLVDSEVPGQAAEDVGVL